MEITQNSWNKYTASQELIRKRAAEAMQRWIDVNGIDDRSAMLEFANILAKQGGEAAGAAACEMYDAVAAAAKANVPAALPADTATFSEVAKAVNGSLKQSDVGNLIVSTVERLVKQVAEDTMLQNAARDRAEFAWIPDGGACAFCITLASQGWQTASKDLLNNHAEHIHANCNCEFAIRFDSHTNYRGYNPDKYKQEYDDAEGRGSKAKINYMRREQYQENKDEINEQKRILYRAQNGND